MMTLSMLAAAFAGCLSDNDESNFDEADGGYEYASNVDNHIMLRIYLMQHLDYLKIV